MIDYEFLKNNKQKLIDIYIKEKFIENNGKDGGLIINFSIKDNMDVYYLSVDNMTIRIRDKFIEDYNKNISVNNNKKKILLMIIDNDILETIIHYLD
jgi:hypothetical protein|tara:strand:- start:282 stop:572 length:291 start_codon:yes stop_codon:yes gene_type:complete